jgi:hypothetical protein
MSESYVKLESLAEALIQKSAEPLTLDQGVERVLKTSEGQRLYASYRLESQPTSVRDLATQELTIEAARIARSGVEKSAAVDLAVERNPDLARAAGHAVVEKADTSAAAKIEAGVAALVEKSGGDLSEYAANDRFLKSAEGRRLYAEHTAERAGLL